jgi:hypothetical protein
MHVASGIILTHREERREKLGDNFFKRFHAIPIGTTGNLERKLSTAVVAYQLRSRLPPQKGKGLQQGVLPVKELNISSQHEQYTIMTLLQALDRDRAEVKVWLPVMLF